MSKRAREAGAEESKPEPSSKRVRMARSESTVNFLSKTFPAATKTTLSSDATTFFIHEDEIYLPMEVYALIFGLVRTMSFTPTLATPSLGLGLGFAVCWRFLSHYRFPQLLMLI